MKKIITAINNPKLNEELKKEKNFKIIGKDIQYKEAILEILEKNNFIDLIIISEKILGEIDLEKLIEKIKIINNKIRIIFILEKENSELEKILIKNKILDIYYNNKINLKDLIKIINKKEIDMEEEIIKLKKIIEEKNNSKNKDYRIKNYMKKIKEIQKNKRKSEGIKNTATKIISFSGNYKSGKSTLSLIIGQYLAEKNYKVLLIDGNLEKSDLTEILNSKKKKDNKIKKVSKNFYFFNDVKYLLKEEKLITLIFEMTKEKYDFIIIELSKNNPEKINKKILKNSHINFIVMEANIFEIKEIKKLLNIYLKEWKIFKNKINIIINKKNINSINKKLISKNISVENKILEVKENKFYYFFMNHYFERKIALKKKTIKKDLDKIIDKIVYDKKDKMKYANNKKRKEEIL